MYTFLYSWDQLHAVYHFNAFRTKASLDLIFFISADESLDWRDETVWDVPPSSYGRLKTRLNSTCFINFLDVDQMRLHMTVTPVHIAVIGRNLRGFGGKFGGFLCVCVYWYQRFPAGADLLLPHLPSGGWLPGGRGCCAAGCATRWLGECDLWPVSAPQLRCTGADSGLCAVAARYRRGPIPPITHTAQVGAILIATLKGMTWYFKSNA